MPTETTQTYCMMPYGSYTVGYTSPPESSTLCVETTETYNDPISRVRPANLVLNPTYLPVQSKLIRSMGYLEDCYPVYWGGGLWVTHCVIYRYFPQLPVGQPGPTNWELDLRLKVKDTVVNLGASIAEFGQTVGMFNSLARHSLTAWKSFRAMKRKFRNLTIDDVATAQLVANFGIAPLLGDLNDSVSALSDSGELNLLRRFVVKKENTASNITAGFQYNWTRSERAICYVKISAGRGRFTLGNLAEVAWEVTPFSFVVDSLIPIGDYLSSLDATKGIESTWGTVTTKLACEILPDPPMKGGGGSFESHKRDVFYDIPLPRIPAPEISGSLRTVANYTALLKLLRSRRK